MRQKLIPFSTGRLRDNSKKENWKGLLFWKILYLMRHFEISCLKGTKMTAMMRSIDLAQLIFVAYEYVARVYLVPCWYARWRMKIWEKENLIFLQKQRFYSFQTFFKNSLCLQKLNNLDSKGAKRSVKIWATNFYKSFFKNVVFHMNVRRSKIRSVHTYGVS